MNWRYAAWPKLVCTEQAKTYQGNHKYTQMNTDRKVDNPTASGGCLCGAIRYEVRGSLRDVIYCHCSQCRRTSGHYVAATAANKDDLVLTAADGLRWYDSSSFARRGFCHKCGSSLFWERLDADTISIMAGTIDAPTNLASAIHICMADAGDYYMINDGLPQSADSSYSLNVPDQA